MGYGAGQGQGSAVIAVLLLVALLAWLGCAVITAFLYDRRGRSSGWGFVVGLLLGLFGIILALLLTTDHKALERRDEKRKLAQVRVGKLRQCPFCGEFIRPEATVCRYCNRDIVRAPQA
jgi:ribosomal protein L32